MGKYACLLLLAAAAAACNTSEKTSTVEVEEPASAVTEYTPAPGQFINSTDAGFGDRTITTPEEAVAYAEERLSRGLYVSLGGWGGYIVAEFDEPVANTGGYDLYVTGNAFDGSSEPGVVWVAVRENGAPGTWYRLRGSEDDNDETLYDYEATYAPSDEEGIAAEWHDNRDGKGTIDRIGVHSQASYVPAWVPLLTYRGVRLPDNVTFDEAANKYIMTAFGWGYADNWSATDRTGAKNRFRIADAVDADGQPADLPQIDYVKVQTCINAKAGNGVGEISTEVCGIGCYRTVTRRE